MSSSKDQILAISMKLFLQKSYREVSMQDIVQATGMSKGAFYHHFSSKEKIFEEVINHYFDVAQMDYYKKLSQESLWDFCLDFIKVTTDKVKKYDMNGGENSGLLRANMFALIFDAIKIIPEFTVKNEIRKKIEMEYWTQMIAKARLTGEIDTELSDAQVAKLFIYQNYGISVYFVKRSDLNELIDEILIQFKNIYQLIKTKH